MNFNLSSVPLINYVYAPIHNNVDVQERMK